jgi:hypothetical protein
MTSASRIGDSTGLGGCGWVLVCGAGRFEEAVSGALGSRRLCGDWGGGAEPCLCSRFRREMP